MTDMYNIILRNSDSTNFRKPIIKWNLNWLQCFLYF
jgi:hypothetical protein